MTVIINNIYRFEISGGAFRFTREGRAQSVPAKLVSRFEISTVLRITVISMYTYIRSDPMVERPRSAPDLEPLVAVHETVVRPGGGPTHRTRRHGPL